MYNGGFKGGFGGGNLQQLMKQAQKMQQEMQEAKEEIANTEFVGSAGGGMVEIKMNGERKVLSVSIKPEVIDVDDKEMLEDLVMASLNDALDQIVKMENEKLPNLPGM